MNEVVPRILCVCTGNICRSPAMERLLSGWLGEKALIGSAGTSAVVGAPIATPMAMLVAEVVPLGPRFAARQLTSALIDEADLILTATRGHRCAVVTHRPAAVQRCFTLVEFADALRVVRPGQFAGSAVERLPKLIELARLNRPRSHLTPSAHDIPDPYGQPQAVYKVAFGTIHQATATIAHALTD